jgi:DNA-binding CsgD family transcriptional regulator
MMALLQAIEAAFAADRIDRGHEAEDAARRVARLRRREREVVDALVAGRSNKVIAYDLGLSVRTVEVHRARMMERLGARQLAEEFDWRCWRKNFVARECSGALLKMCHVSDPAAFLKGVAIDDSHVSRSRQCNQSPALKVSQSAAHRLH